MIRKIVSIKNFGKFKDPSFGGQNWNGVFQQTNIIYANNGSGKTTLSLLFRSLKGNNEIVLKKKSFSSKDNPDIKLLDEANKEIKFSKNKWNRHLRDIEIFDSFFIEDNVYIITIKDNLQTPNLFEILLGEESITVRKEIDEQKEEIKKLKNKRTSLRYKRKHAETDELRAEFQEKMDANVEESKKVFKNIDELENKIIELAKEHRDNYLEKINFYLRMFNPNLKLTKLSPKKFKVIYALQVSGHSVRTDEKSLYSLRYSLSEGDKNALSLSFFMAKLDLLPDLDKKIIIIDDPISSFDYSRKNTTINNLINLSKKVKLFILLTHDLTFANDFSRRMNYSNQNLKIDYNGNTSNIVEHDIEREALTGVFKDLTVLHDYLKNGATNDIERRDIARCIRPALEGIFRIKYFGEITRTEWLGNVIDKIRDASPTSNFAHHKDKLQELIEINDYSKEYHHSNPYYLETPINDEELRVYTTRTIDLLRKI